MERGPFHHETQRPQRELARKDREVVNTDTGLFATVPSVGMRRSMICPVRIDGNPEELTELWQCIFFTLSASSLSST
jgi:hypothetical protein